MLIVIVLAAVGVERSGLDESGCSNCLMMTYKKCAGG